MTNNLIPYSFVPGTKAKANEVNANFIALASGIATNSTQVATKLNKDLSNITSAGLDFLKENTAPTRNIGEIVSSTLPLTDAGLHLLDGSLIYNSGIYSEFVDYISGLDLTANYFCSEADWQTSVNTYGVCGKFVYDSTNNTVRLPKVTGKIDGTTDVTALGELAEQFIKLPSITGTIVARGNSGNEVFASATGIAAVGGTQANYGIGTSSGISGKSYGTITLDASRSSSVYSGNGTDTKIHEQAVKCYYYIVIATSSKTDIQVDIDEIATDLNSKADTDLTNVTDTGYIKMAGASMPSDKYIDLTLGASGTSYTAPANGYILCIKSATANGQYITLQDSTSMFSTEIMVPNASWIRAWLPVAKNDIFSISYNASGATQYFRFIYAVGSESEFV